MRVTAEVARATSVCIHYENVETGSLRIVTAAGKRDLFSIG